MQLGAEPLVDRGDGDDQHYLGIDGGLDPWLNNLWDVLLKKYPIPPGLSPVSDASLRVFFTLPIP